MPLLRWYPRKIIFLARCLTQSWIFWHWRSISLGFFVFLHCQTYPAWSASTWCGRLGIDSECSDHPTAQLILHLSSPRCFCWVEDSQTYRLRVHAKDGSSGLGCDFTASMSTMGLYVGSLWSRVYTGPNILHLTRYRAVVAQLSEMLPRTSVMVRLLPPWDTGLCLHHHCQGSRAATLVFPWRHMEPVGVTSSWGDIPTTLNR